MSNPLSLDDLFEAQLKSTSAASAATPEDIADASESTSPADPVDIDHEDEADDVDTDRPELDPESDSEDDDDAELTPTGPTFADLGLPRDLLRAITDMGFVSPTDIQREAIPVLLEGRDVVGVAQTGTGKTAAFGLPLLNEVDSRDGEVQALVLAPTRELAMQSADAIADMAHRSRGLDVVAVYGGSPYGPQIAALREGAQVVVGTPGRVIDLIEKGALVLDHVRYFVLDEADEMLRMGFAEDVETIAASLPSERRTALFSATMPPAIESVAAEHLNDPVRIEVSRQSSTVDSVQQSYAVVPFRHKVGAVSRILAVTDAEAAIVFVRTKSTAEDVAIELSGRGIQAAAISGDVPQRERERLIERLRQGSLDVLVATDVAARGLDVDRIGLVVNFDVPREAEAYVHRIGRTGRAGRTGEAITFLTPKEKGKLRQIERLTGARLEEITLPSPADVSRHRAAKLLKRADERAQKGRLDIYHELIAKEVSSLDSATLAATLLALAVGDDGPRWQREDSGRKERREVQVDSEGTFISASFEHGRERPGRENRPERPRRAPRRDDAGGTVYRVEVGHRDKVLPGAIVGALANEGGISGSDIGKIDILQSFSLVTIYAPLDEQTLQRMGKATFAGRELRIRPDEGPGHGWSGPNDRHKAKGMRDDADSEGGRSAYRPRREEGRYDREDRGFKRDDRGFKREDRGFKREDRGFKREDRGFKREDRGFKREDRGFKREDRGFKRDDRGGRFNERSNSRGGYSGYRDERSGYQRGSNRDDRGGYGRSKRY